VRHSLSLSDRPSRYLVRVVSLTPERVFTNTHVLSLCESLASIKTLSIGGENSTSIALIPFIDIVLSESCITYVVFLVCEARQSPCSLTATLHGVPPPLRGSRNQRFLDSPVFYENGSLAFFGEKGDKKKEVSDRYALLFSSSRFLL